MFREIKRFDVLGVGVSAINMDEAYLVIRNAIMQRKKIYVSTCPVGTIMAGYKNKEVLKSLNSAMLATPDGMPVVWLGRLKGYKHIRRVYGPDLMREACRLSEGLGYRNYLYGSTSYVLDKLQNKLKKDMPNLMIAGVFSPAFRDLSEKEDAKDIEIINSSNSDILWVGLGSPKQDLWMNRYRDKLNVPVIIGVGAAFDFLAGTKPQAPRWMMNSGLEWLHRLITEPKRLWRRYLINNTLFLYYLTLESLLKVFAFHEKHARKIL